MFRIKRSNLLQSKEFWNEMTLPPLNNVSHLFRGGRVIQYGAPSTDKSEPSTSASVMVLEPSL